MCVLYYCLEGHILRDPSEDVVFVFPKICIDTDESSTRGRTEKSTRGQRKHELEVNPEKCYIPRICHCLGYRRNVLDQSKKKISRNQSILKWCHEDRTGPMGSNCIHWGTMIFGKWIGLENFFSWSGPVRSLWPKLRPGCQKVTNERYGTFFGIDLKWVFLWTRVDFSRCICV